jgi:hypothetical protein
MDLSGYTSQVIWRPEGKVQALIYHLCLMRDRGRLIFWEDEDSGGRFFEIWIKEI